MSEQEIINILGGFVAAIIGWFIRVLWEAQTKINTQMSDLERRAVDTYVRRDDYKDDIADIKKMLAVIFERLEERK